MIIPDTSSLTYVGEATWVGANGDAISLTFQGRFVPSNTRGFCNVETMEIVDGTGRFAGASGWAVVGGQLDAGNLSPLGPAQFEGTISTPGSLRR